MTESQQLLYGSEWWLGPVFLAGALLLYWYLSNAPFTARGRRRAEQRNQRIRGRSARDREFLRRRGLTDRDRT
jgi:hypothetical protein